MKGIVIYIPERFLKEVKGFAEDMAKEIPGFSMSRLLYLVHLIISQKQETHPGSYAPLKMEYMTNIIPFARKYLYFLRDRGVIEWTGHYAGNLSSNKKFTRLYRVTKDYEGATVCRTLTDPKLCYKIEMQYLKVKKENSKKYPNLNKWVYKVQINEAKAKQRVNEVYKENVLQGVPNAESIKTYGLNEIAKIVRGEIYIRVSKTNGRYDSNFTRLPSYLVPYLTINNLSLIEIDIANSQPFFAGCLFNPSPEVRAIMGNSLYIYEKSLQLAEKEDVKQFIKLVSEGLFYDYMMSEFDKNKIPYTDRDDFKKQLFIVFFGRNSARYVSRSVKLFEKLFPNVFALFAHVKKGEHNQLAILLQKIESNIILNRVAPQISASFPELPFITKHDSLLPVQKSGGFIVPGHTVEAVKGIVENVIRQTTGLTPLVRVKDGFFSATPSKTLNISENNSKSYILYHYI